jgi:methyl-accepting chemotaxis protein/methyl-accepting chemotaxis protein-1 (serine sensor receptor)
MENWKVGEVHGAFEVVQSMKEADAQIAASLWKGAGLALVVVALAAMLFYVFVSRNAIGPLVEVATGLSTGANEVRSAASQVATSAQALAEGASRQAAALEETSGSVEDMESMIKESTSHARDVAALMKQVDSRVEDSNRFLDEMVVAMSSIKDSSSRVSKIIKTIDEIAFQTNILALNAAVEAARAGEAGLGFSVVADEVRSLAQRSAAAARDTATLIEESSGKASEGQARVGQVVGAISAITESIGSVRQLVESLSTSSERQARGIVQVTQAINDIEQVTQSSAAASEESAAAGQELLAQVEYSVSLASALDVMVGRSGGAAPSPRPGPRERTRPGTVLSMPDQRLVEDDMPLATGTHGR